MVGQNPKTQNNNNNNNKMMMMMMMMFCFVCLIVCPCVLRSLEEAGNISSDVLSTSQWWCPKKYRCRHCVVDQKDFIFFAFYFFSVSMGGLWLCNLMVAPAAVQHPGFHSTLCSSSVGVLGVHHPLPSKGRLRNPSRASGTLSYPRSIN